MSITAAISGYLSLGNMKGSYGTYTDSSAGTADDINTGLHKVYCMILQPSGSSVDSNAPSVNETLPTDGSAVSCIVDASSTGYWVAFGV